MIESLILAIDLGTSSMKVALIIVSGKVVDWETEPVRLLILHQTAAPSSLQMKREQDEDPRIEAGCCSTQGDGTTPVDKMAELSAKPMWPNNWGCRRISSS